MEFVMNEQNNNQNIEQQSNNAQPAVNGDQGNGKMFTQDEVNQIVSERLKREREKSAPKPADERETALTEREKAVAAKESAYRCRDYLAEVNISEKYRQSFMDALDTADFDKFKKAVDILGKGFVAQTEVTGANTSNPPCNDTQDNADQRISAAFKPKF